MKRKQRAEEKQADARSNAAVDFDIKTFFKAPDSFTDEDFLGTIANPYHFRSWWNSIQAHPIDSYPERAVLYQRALTYLPGSYKLWFNFLRESKKYVNTNIHEFVKEDPTEEASFTEVVTEIFERSLVYMNKMPKIWLDYAKYLAKVCKSVSRTREVYDRALNTLPITQHQLIWDQCLDWACSLEDFPDTGCHFFRRYIQYRPQDTEDYIDYLLKNDLLEEALELYVKVLDDESFVSKKGNKSRYQLWMELCEFIAKSPLRSQHLTTSEGGPEYLIRHALSRYTDEVGRLWIFLADYFLRQGLFGRARDVFEEALSSVTTARDFGIVFNAYMKFEEQMIEAEIEEQAEQEEDEGVEDQIDRLLQFTFREVPERQDEVEQAMKDEEEDKQKDDELRFFRLENLIQRRPFLLSNVVLRQNPNNVYEWLNRVKLCESLIDATNEQDGSNAGTYLTIKTFTEAISSVDPLQAFGKPSKLWIAFAQFYERNDEDLENANLLFHKASQLQYKSLDELANIYCAWAEMHLRHRNYEAARQVLEHACQGSRPSKVKKEEDSGKRVGSLHANLKIWSFYVDLLENLGHAELAKKAYQRMLELKIATPQTVLNYTQFLQKRTSPPQYEESFRVYERALQVFSEWPHAHEIWLCYLKSMIERYADSKVERIRDLFQQVLNKVPPKFAKVFYYMFADYEENFGLLNHAMEIYDRGCKDLQDPKDRYEILNLQIAKAAEYFGVTRTRELFERAFNLVESGDRVQMGLRFAKMERKMGEVDRARAIYQHLSQFCNPRQREMEEQFWQIWEKFEVYHGNEDTYSDYMRTKRTVELRYSVAVPILTGADPSKPSLDLENIAPDIGMEAQQIQ